MCTLRDCNSIQFSPWAERPKQVPRIQESRESNRRKLGFFLVKNSGPRALGTRARSTSFFLLNFPWNFWHARHVQMVNKPGIPKQVKDWYSNYEISSGQVTFNANKFSTFKTFPPSSFNRKNKKSDGFVGIKHELFSKNTKNWRYLKWWVC